MATLGSLAALVGGDVLGNAELDIRDITDLHSAGPQDLSFVANAKYRPALERSQAGAVLLSKDLANEISSAVDRSFIVCDAPYLAMARIAEHLHPRPKPAPGVEDGAIVAPTAHIAASATIRIGAIVDAEARLDDGVVVGPGAYVGRHAQVGSGAELGAGSKVMDRCVIGARVILQPGAVVGSDGFGYAPDAAGRRHKIPQVGIVEVGDDAEIGANATIDRATFGVTRIGAGTKIDNLVQVAHNVETGEHCVVVSQSGIAGSTRLGNRVVMGAQTGVAGHVSIADDVALAARAAVAGDIRAPGVYSGVPAQPHRSWRRVTATQKSLPELRSTVRALARRVETLERALDSEPEQER